MPTPSKQLLEKNQTFHATWSSERINLHRVFQVEQFYFPLHCLNESYNFHVHILKSVVKFCAHDNL